MARSYFYAKRIVYKNMSFFRKQPDVVVCVLVEGVTFSSSLRTSFDFENLK